MTGQEGRISGELRKVETSREVKLDRKSYGGSTKIVKFNYGRDTGTGEKEGLT